MIITRSRAARIRLLQARAIAWTILAQSAFALFLRPGDQRRWLHRSAALHRRAKLCADRAQALIDAFEVRS